jgi:hypothetical protein
MSDQPSASRPFVAVFPVWGIAGPNSVILGPDGTTARFAESAVFQLIEVDGKQCCPIVTDEDLAERHARKHNLVGWMSIGLGSAAQLILYLSCVQKCGISWVAVDPGETHSGYRDIAGIITELGQQL